MNTIEFWMEMNRNAASKSKKTMFVHEGNEVSTRWHYGDCFPDVDTCKIPDGGDMEEGGN